MRLKGRKTLRAEAEGCAAVGAVAVPGDLLRTQSAARAGQGIAALQRQLCLPETSTG